MYIAPKIEKKYDLSFKINSQLGYGHLRRNIFNINFLRTVTSQGSKVVKLAPGGTLTQGATSILQVETDRPLDLSGKVDDTTTVGLSIQRFLLIDQSFESCELTNNGDETAIVKVVWGLE